jgi:hypothetical protein
MAAAAPAATPPAAVDQLPAVARRCSLIPDQRAEGVAWDGDNATGLIPGGVLAGLSTSECVQACDGEPRCRMYVHQAAGGKCWRWVAAGWRCRCAVCAGRAACSPAARQPGCQQLRQWRCCRFYLTHSALTPAPGTTTGVCANALAEGAQCCRRRALLPGCQQLAGMDDRALLPATCTLQGAASATPARRATSWRASPAPTAPQWRRCWRATAASRGRQPWRPVSSSPSAVRQQVGHPPAACPLLAAETSA